MTPPSRPRILLITRNLPPLVGGMERLNWHLAEELAKQAQVHIVGPQGCAPAARRLRRDLRGRRLGKSYGRRCAEACADGSGLADAGRCGQSAAGRGTGVASKRLASRTYSELSVSMS